MPFLWIFHLCDTCLVTMATIYLNNVMHLVALVHTYVVIYGFHGSLLNAFEL